VTKEIRIFNEPRFVATVEIINSIVNDSSLVVEIGAADASFKRFVKSNKWITIDKYGDPDIKVDLNGTNIELPFQRGSVDAVICTEVLEHLTIGSPLVKEISRILKPAGRAIISVPNIVSLKARLYFLLGKLPPMAASGDCGNIMGGTGILIDGHWVGAHVVDFNTARLYKYLARSGLTVDTHWSIPLAFNRPIKFSINGKFVPKSLLDFIVITARPETL